MAFGQLRVVADNCAERNPQARETDFPSNTPVTPHVIHRVIHRLC
jgi:hypothetical protein